MTALPDRTEAAEYYFTYIDQVPEGDICGLLDAQGNDTLALLDGISEEESLHRYAPGKWSIRDVVNHLSDTERLFVFRAFWFARGFESPLPSFDQTTGVAAASADDRSWRSSRRGVSGGPTGDGGLLSIPSSGCMGAARNRK